MKLSIIVPVYNASKYLEECLDSLAKCDISDTEIILINDGSMDNSGNICKEYVEKNNIFKYYEKPNGGVSQTRNTGLEKATGEYIFFFDSDDYLSADAFKYIKEAINTGYDFTAFSYTTLWDNGKTKDELFDLGNADKSNDINTLYKFSYADSCLNTCWGKLFKKSIIDGHEIRFDENLPIGEDFKFVAEYVQYVNTCELSNESIIYYRQHGESAMRRYAMVDRMKDNDILYEFQKNLVTKLISEKKLPYDFIYTMNNYYLRVLTNLCREFASCRKCAESVEVLLNAESTKKILNGVKAEWLGTLKKFEYKMLCKKNASFIAFYFRLKGLL